MAAWLVRPPLSVTTADARFITGTQSGSVCFATSTAPSSNRSASAMLRSAIARPLAMRLPTATPRTSTGPVPSSVNVLTLPVCSRERTVSGRACTMYSAPSTPSLAHSTSIGQP